VVAEIRLLVLDQMAWTQVTEDPPAFAAEHLLTLGVEPDLLWHSSNEPAQLRLRTPSWRREARNGCPKISTGRATLMACHAENDGV
jgi:hypothetical protein